MDRVRPGDVLVPWECITQTLVLFRDKAKSRSGFNLITVQMIARRQEHFDAEMLAPCGNMSCGSGAVESHHSVPWEEVPYFKGMVIFQRNIGGQFWELCRVVAQCAESSWACFCLPGRWDLSGCERVAQHFGKCEGRWFFLVTCDTENCWTPLSSVKYTLTRCWLPPKELSFESNLVCKYFLLLLVGCFDSKFEEMIL